MNGGCMKKTIRLLLLAIFFAMGTLHVHALFLKNEQKNSSRITLSDLRALCGQYAERAQDYSKSAIEKKEFEKVLEQYKTMIAQQLAPQDLWLNGKQPLNEALFNPFVQKLVPPEGSQVAMWGDLHGSVHSLLRSLAKLKTEGYIDDMFRIIKPDFYMFFLGDFVDRGKYGIEVIYTLLRLKLANLDKVFLVRGNHEDIDICSVYGFGDELAYKFGYDIEEDPVHSIYETMPMAIFLGRPNSPEFIQCCHGGIEPGFDPQALLSSEGSSRYEWLDVLRRGDWIVMLPVYMQQALEGRFRFTDNFKLESPTSPASIGFMWHDFVDNDSKGIGYETFGRGWKFGEYLTRFYTADSWLKASTYKIRSIIRAHQHNGKMLENLVQNKGIYSLWNGLVYTLLSAPAMGIEDFAYDSFLIVGVEDSWPIKHFYTPIPA